MCLLTQMAQQIPSSRKRPEIQRFSRANVPFRMTARDMARFGLLYLRNGKWRDQQVIPAQWVRESTTAYSVADGNARDNYSGYGYLWWVAVNGNHYPKVEVPDGSFSAWVWEYVNGKPLQNRHRTAATIPARTEISDALSKDLKGRGFKFVGSTIMYAFMQATGMVNDHLQGCFCRGKPR